MCQIGILYDFDGAFFKFQPLLLNYWQTFAYVIRNLQTPIKGKLSNYKLLRMNNSVKCC